MSLKSNTGTLMSSIVSTSSKFVTGTSSFAAMSSTVMLYLSSSSTEMPYFAASSSFEILSVSNSSSGILNFSETSFLADSYSALSSSNFLLIIS